MAYANVPHSIGFVISSRLCSPHELQTIYGLEDMWDMIEVHSVNIHNQNMVARGNNH
ncbi:transglycosylase [Paraburkholderia tuberum]|uniref:Uncharacterized protein n=1 Tax=Paraburkholderia tuberum TaxID=157910 RepID=A0A1H1GWZ5_9BURK|nr:transglycosylase [Paraburkholderia tuberum]SDR17732.1 hypothetical protein SAMN05445850_3135 [Paraburkholderia tuberum]